MTGINFNNCRFTEPELLPSRPSYVDTVLSEAGLYVILVPDATWRPRTFMPLYFGESETIHARATGTHEKCATWNAKKPSYGPLYRAFCPMPLSTREQRQQVESALIAKFNTLCNERLSFDFAGYLGGTR